MNGHLYVEQWLTPLPGASSALMVTRIRKFGMTVATTEGTVRRLAGGQVPPTLARADSN